MDEELEEVVANGEIETPESAPQINESSTLQEDAAAPVVPTAPVAPVETETLKTEKPKSPEPSPIGTLPSPLQK